MEERLEYLLKRGFRLTLLGVAMKFGTFLLQADSPSVDYSNKIYNSAELEIYNPDTTNLKKVDKLYDLCND
jgi:hypothetical protein